jgi:hypothetical protein
MEKRRQRKQFEELEALQQPRSPYRRRAERKDGTTSYSALAARGPAPASSAKPSFKSSEEGLEQDFNSLHAQREGWARHCGNYIKDGLVPRFTRTHK